MPVLTPPRIQQSLADVRAAVRLVQADPLARALADDPGRTDELGRWLYARWWCGIDHPAVPNQPVEASAYAPLEAARRRVSTRDPGWLVLAVGEEMVVAAHLHRRERTAVRSDAVVASSRPGLAARPGDLVSLLSGGSSTDETGAWWWATTTRPGLSTEPVDRWYVHVTDLASSLRVVPVLLDLLAGLGGGAAGASLKCPPVPELYGRRDALVVYLPRAVSTKAEAALQDRAVDLAVLADDTPPLTRRLLPGVGSAQDPGGDVSYGQLRCGQVAAVCASAALDPTDASVLAALAAAGIDPDQPERLT